MIKRLVNHVLVAFTAGAAMLSGESASAIQFGGVDSRIQVIDYQPSGTMTIEAALGRHLVMTFAADETIVTVSIGDSSAWQVSASEDRVSLFVRPLTTGETTNLIVVTNVRTYAFDLVATGTITSSTAYTVRFRYPEADLAMAETSTESASAIIGRYRVSGADLITPIAIDDDGRSTHIVWGPNAPLPATYVIDANGNEAIVNGQMRGDRYILDRVAQRLVFRLDRRIARAERVGEDVVEP